eukprot:12851317-Prorocentrum_lima.AAC.1
MSQTQRNHIPGPVTHVAQVQPKHAQGPVTGGLDVGSMVLGGMDDGTTTQCYFVSAHSTNTPCAPSPPAGTQSIKKADGKK